MPRNDSWNIKDVESSHERYGDREFISNMYFSDMKIKSRSHIGEWRFSLYYAILSFPRVFGIYSIKIHEEQNLKKKWKPISEPFNNF